MNVVRISDAPTYTPPEHFDIRCLGLQGYEAGQSESIWIGMSHLLPGGSTSLTASAVEKHYVVLEGSVTISTGEIEVTLNSWDSCRLEAGEKRKLENRTNRPATILLAMPYANGKE